MKNKFIRRLLAIASSLILSSGWLSATECNIRKVGTLPVETGRGTAGAFIGTIGEWIVVAGGSDFPDGFSWEGGEKKWSDDIYLISASDYKAKLLKDVKFPVKIGNGCSVSDGKHIWCIGGTDGTQQNNIVYKIIIHGDKVEVSEATCLPEGFRPASAALYKGNAYIHGTTSNVNKLYRLNLTTLSWNELSPCPGKPVSEATVLVHQHNGHEDALYMIGGRGFDEDGYHILSKVMEYLPTSDKWTEKTQITIDGTPTVWMGATAVPYGSGHILVFGGDNGKEFVHRANLETIIKNNPDKVVVENAEKELTDAFLSHKGFCNKIFSYHPITDTWITLDSAQVNFPVVTTAIRSGDKIIIVSGEEKPCVRTPDILEITIHDKVSFGWINYLVIIIYLAGMMGVGFYFSRKEKSTDQFFKGGSNIPWWAAGISIFATALSAITFLSIPAKAYAADWRMFMFNMMIIFTIPIVTHFYLPFFRKLNVASAYQYLENRFGVPARLLASSFFCLFMFARVAIVLFLPSLALNAVTGLNIYLCIILMGGVTIIYCTMGGIEAVVWGDVIQGFILVAGAITAVIWLVSGVEGGLGTVMEIAIENKKFNILDFSMDWTKPVFWVTVIGGFANQLLTYSSDQSVIQRYVTVKDTAGAKKGLWLNGLLSIPITILFFAIGTGLYAFFRTHPAELSVGMNNTDSIFPHYIMCEFPAGMAGLLIAAIFAAAMSTLSSNINSASTVMTEDFYSKFKKGVTDKQKMNFARISGVVIGLLGIAMAVMLATFDIASLWDQFNFFLGLLTSGIGGLFMMGVFFKRIGLRAAMTGFAGSVIVLLIFNGHSEVSTTLYGFIGLVSCCLTGWLSSFIYGYGK